MGRHSFFYAIYETYSSKEEYKDDFRLLFIVWDDYVNEVISALISPQSGMVTSRSFWTESDFSIIDGVFVVRHQHQFNRGMYGQELLNGLDHLFHLKNQLPVAFIQNPKGRVVPQEIVESFSAIVVDNEWVTIAEYRAVDLVDWRTGIGIVGLDSVPMEHHKRVLQVIIDSTNKHEPRTNADAANFTTVNLDYIAKQITDENGKIDWNTFFSELKDAVELTVRFQKNVELMEQKYNEEVNKDRHQEMIKH